MDDLLSLVCAKYTQPNEQTEQRNKNHNGWDHCNPVRNDRMTVSVHSTLEVIGRHATRGEIARQRGKNIDHASLARVPGIVISVGRAFGRAAYFYWFSEDET